MVREPGRVPLWLVVVSTLPIGRAGTGLLLGDERLSRYHCELRVGSAGELLIRDAGSSNGTFVNGSRLDGEVELVAGDLVLIGDTTIAVDHDRVPEPPGAHDPPSGISATVAGVDPTGLKASAVGGTVTLVFSDIVDSTVRNAQEGDRAWLELLQEHDRVMREQLVAHGGTEVKSQGDGFFLTFPSARRGLLFAVDAQRALAARRDEQSDFALHVRIGVHTGEVLHDDGDLFGRHVHLAARVSAQAGRDEIVASTLVYELVAPMGDFVFGPTRQVALKGFEGVQEVREVLWRPVQGDGPTPSTRPVSEA